MRPQSAATRVTTPAFTRPAGEVFSFRLSTSLPETDEGLPEGLTQEAIKACNSVRTSALGLLISIAAGEEEGFTKGFVVLMLS